MLQHASYQGSRTVAELWTALALAAFFLLASLKQINVHLDDNGLTV